MKTGRVLYDEEPVTRGGMGLEWRREEFSITDERERIDLDVVCYLLARSYWAGERPRRVIEASIDNSLCFSVFQGRRQIGFARAVTDKIVFSWIMDVVIDADFRGRGLGKWLIACAYSFRFLPKEVTALFFRVYGCVDY